MLSISFFCLLTVITQVGGLVYLVYLATRKRFNRWSGSRFYRILLRGSYFVLLYSVVSFLLVPVIAQPFGRVPLPLISSNNLQPLSLITCLLNRHYVHPRLRETAMTVSRQMAEKYPGTRVNYLDANFPFLAGFPLFPHLSHNDGKKLDISFCYKETGTGMETNKVPSVSGYGICEEPVSPEVNTARDCAEKGYWQYNLLKKITPRSNGKKYSFDETRTGELIRLFADQPGIEKLFLEPHLKSRLKLTSGKIRFHGCQAVRHDDHLHVQIR